MEEGMALGYLPFDDGEFPSNGGSFFGQDPTDTFRTSMVVAKLVNDPEIKAETDELIDSLRPAVLAFVHLIRENTPKLTAALDELLKEE